MLAFILLAILTIQAEVRDDVARLRKFLGADFPMAMQLLAEENDRSIRGVSPSEAARIREETKPPASLTPGLPVFPLGSKGVGRGLVNSLFEPNFVTRQVNLAFCQTKPERIIAVQVLFDDRLAVGDTVSVLLNVYQLPKPVPFATWHPAVAYRLQGVQYDPSDNHWTLSADAPPVTVWDLGTAEAVYQPVKNHPEIYGQIWIGDRNAAKTCAP
jgi:hypothetical protein